MSLRPVESSHSLIVAHPIRVVHEFVADFGHAARWDPATLCSAPVSSPVRGAPVRVGSEWTTRSALAGRMSTGHYRLEWNTSYGVVLAGRHPGLTRTVEFALVDLGDHTEVHLTMRYQTRGLAAASRLGRQRGALVELARRAATNLPAALRSHAGGSRDPAGGNPPRRANQPSQVVDLWHLGWRLISGGDAINGGMYTANPTGAGAPRTLGDLAATRGPLRPVVGPSAADIHEIDQLLALARKRAAPSIAAAVHAAYARLRETHADLGADLRGGLARQRLTSASEATPPAAALLALLAEPEPATSAIHPATRDVLARMITRWVGHPDHYTDPAVTLVTVVPPRLMPGPMRRARRAWLRIDPTLSLADAQLARDAPDPESQS
ncbi:MAG: SRPBCC family protein [Pseudonocardia sp.]|nr:SRPBCC family protein [Pseudonocardia sp.]